MAPQPLQQISPFGKRIIGDSSSQKFATAEVSSDPLINLVDIVIDRVIAHHARLTEVAFDLRNQQMRCCQANLLQVTAFEKAKERVQSQTPLLMLPALSKQGVRISTKRKSPKVEEEVNPIASPKGAKPFGRKLIKIAAKKPTTKKAKVAEVIPDPSVLELEPLDEDLDDATTFSNLIKKGRRTKTSAEWNH